MRFRVLLGSIAAVGVALGMFAACGNSTFDASSIDDAAAADAPLDDGSVSLRDGATLDASGDAGACASAYGPLMISVPTPPSYCIDSTEVTRAQYALFITAIAHGYTPPADARCDWNNMYPASAGCLSSLVDAGQDFPITCIDWCDAFSFCAWAGKTLCGKIGSTDPLTIPSATDKSVSQWENACSANGTREFPYGSDYIDGGCNLHKPGGIDAISAAASPAYAQCVGGYDGLRDMTGNAEEWLNACNDVDASDTKTANCVTMGGSFAQSEFSPPGQCSDYGYTQRQAQRATTGFRCCSN